MEDGKKNKSFIECFFDFMSDSENLNQEDIKSELEDLGVDTEKLAIRASEIVTEGLKMRRLAWQKNAREKRIQIEKMIESKKVKGATQDLKNKLKEILSGKYGLPAQSFAEAYFRKMDSLSKNDLKSLVKDMENLDLLEEIIEEE